MRSLPRLALLVGLAWLAGCAGFDRFPVAGELLDEDIRTTVDSADAQYYLNHYLQGERLDANLDGRIDALYAEFPGALPTRAELREIARRHSNDFAALYLADRLWREPANRELQRRFHRHLARPDARLFAPPADAGDYLVLIVPGWNYAANGHVTGSDFAAPRRLLDRLGLRHELVPVPPNGSVTQSAEVIAARLLAHDDPRRKLIVVGASAAGPAIHYTLGELLEPAQLGAVAAWVNLGGILRGSPLIDHFQRLPQRLAFDIALALKGWDRDEVLSLSAGASRERVERLRLPARLLVINYLGLSLTGSLSGLASYKYPLIADEGPNDGLTPLVDIIAPGSLTLVATGSDHYFMEDPEIERKTVAIVKTVLDTIRDFAAR